MDLTLKITPFKILVFLLTLISIEYWLLRTFRNRLSLISQTTVSSYIRSKKYIKKLFIEIGNNNESLRYFIYKTKWKHRIINIFNQLYTQQRHLFKQYLPNFTSHLPWYARFYTIERIRDIINSNESMLKDLNHINEHVASEFQHYNNMHYEKHLHTLKSWLSLMETNKMMLLSTAGNGKSSMLCNISELIIKLKQPCLFLNAKDIHTDIDTYIKKSIKIPKKIDTIAYKIINLYLFIVRKRWFIIIDAINENDIDNFKTSLNEFIKHIQDYSRINIILSCRSEYYEQRFSDYFGNFFKYVVERPGFDDCPKLMNAYSRAYNFTGSVNMESNNTLTQQLLLLRIFFEVYQNTNKTFYHINKHTLYTKYLDSTINNDQRVNTLLQKIVNCMVEQYVFDNVFLDTIYEYKEQINKIADGSILICITIKQNKNTLMEMNKEVIIFPFDELRDYCIARYMLMQNNDDVLFSLIERFYNDSLSPLEGVLTHAYSFFKELDRVDKCIKILDKYASKIRMHKYNSENLRYFNLYLVLCSGEELHDFEYQYLLHRFIRNSDEFINALRFLMNNELEKRKPNASLLTEILIKSRNFSNIEKFIEHICIIVVSSTKEIAIVSNALEYLGTHDKLSSSFKELFAVLPLDVSPLGLDKAKLCKLARSIAERCVCKEFKEYINNIYDD